MTITEESWKQYIETLSKVESEAARLMQEFLEANREPDGRWNSRETRQLIIDYAFALAVKYGEAAAELACEMYDSVGALEDIILPSAEPAQTATYQETAKTVNGTIKLLNPVIIAAAIGRLVRQAGVDTTVNNAIRDKAEWAWIPIGDTCPFCISLAHEGWKQASKAALSGGHAEHVHANCDCNYAIRHKKETNYAGYDPRKYARIFNDAEGDTEKEKLDAIAREQYAANADEIRARKREEYAQRKEREEMFE